MKETISKVKRQPSAWEKIIANETTDKELISKVYKHSQKKKKKKQPNQKVSRRLKQTFSKEDREMSSTYRCLHLLSTHEKTVSIARYWRNANQNYNEVSPHTGQNVHHQKIYKQ